MSRLTEAEREAVHLLHWAPINSTPAGCPLCIDAVGTVEAIVARRLAPIEALAEQWNSTPDYAPTDYDQGRVDQRHDMTTQLLEALAPAAEGDAGVGS